MVRDLLQLNTFSKRLFIGSVLVLATLCATYGFLLKQTVASVVERRSIEAEKSELAARVSTLEAEYIAAADTVTLQTAQEYGFRTVQATRFVSRAPQAFSFDYRTNE